MTTSEDEVEGDEELTAENDLADDEGEDESASALRRDRERGRDRFERGDVADRVDRDDRRGPRQWRPPR